MDAIFHALAITGSMTWEITWALILGFALSAVIQAVVRRSTVVRLLGDGRPRTLAIAAGLGAASSSCSYAAVALARALFRKGADFTAAMAFEIASTNLVIELGVILALLMGWQFTLAEFTGGPVMIVILSVLFRIFLRERLLRQAHEQADRGLAGSMEGHAAMDMSVRRDGSFARRLFSKEGFTSVSHVFVMEWAAVIRDLVIGLLVAGAIAAWVPDSFWRAFFFAGHPLAARLWGPLIGPVVAIISFVCSIGNVPLAVVLWKGGISFGGVVAFIFADLIIAPILNIYRKYYGPRMALFILGTFFAAMAAAGYVIELVFGGLGLIPDRASAKIPTGGVSWDYTTWLNIAFLILAAVLVARFARTGGGMMLKMMGGAPEQPGEETSTHTTACTDERRRQCRRSCPFGIPDSRLRPGRHARRVLPSGERLQHEGGDLGLQAGGHDRGAQSAAGQHRQHQPGGRLRIGAGAEIAIRLGTPDQVGQVTGDREHCLAGRPGQLGLGGQRGRVGEQHPVPGSSVVSMPGPGAGICRGLARLTVHGPGQHVGQQPGRRAGAFGQVVHPGSDLGRGTPDDGGEQRGLGTEVLEDHRLGHADPLRHVGDLRGTVTGLGEHLGGGVQDRLPPLGCRQPGPPRRPAVSVAFHARCHLAL
jgi:uncharacterized protein